MVVALVSWASVAVGQGLPVSAGVAVSPPTGVGIDQKLDAQVPSDLALRDEDGKTVRLGDYFTERPLVLSLVYLKCPGLCSVTLNSLARSLRSIRGMNVGADFDVLTVSFDPTEQPALAAAKRQEYLRLYDRPAAEKGWHFLTGDTEAIRRLTDAVGFRYRWDQDRRQFIHPGGIMVLTPAGKVSRYLIGVDYPPQVLEQSLTAAGAAQIGRVDEQPVLYCFVRDPRTGKLTLVIARALRIGGILIILCIGLLLLFMIRRHPTTMPGA
jgi:protein SCO1/2